jgi:2'-hydroxyisoflavone reductase
MKLLILGGTQFVGFHITQAALANGHQVTLFNRGKTNPTLFPQTEKLQGDRVTDLSSLEGRTWDAVIDVNAYHPNVLRKTLAVLNGQVGQYTFISTVSVHPDGNVGDDENAPLAPEPDEELPVGGETYGGFKVACERLVQEAFPDNTLIIRPGLVIGSHDHTDRFNYWVVRASLGGDMLLPPSDSILQVIDARDLAQFTVKLTQEKTTGIYEATGIANSVTIGQVFEIAKRITQSDTTPVWATDEFLLENGVQPFADLPLWLPKSDSGFYQRSVKKATDAGLTFHNIDDSIQDFWMWWQRERLGSALKAGMNPDKEREILEKWASA